MADRTKAKRLIATVLILALLVSLLPATILSASAASRYGKIIKKDVFLRYEPGSSGYNCKLPLNWIVEVIDSTTSGGSLWYKVNAKNPVTTVVNDGLYVKGDCLEILTDDGYNTWVAQGKPDAGDFKSAPEGTTVTAAPTTAAPTAEAPTAAPTSTSGAAEESANPTVSVAPTAIPAAGYVKLVLSSANLRDAADGKKVNEWQPKHGVVMPYVEAPTTKNNYTWYKIKFADGKNYFVRSDTIVLCDAAGNQIGVVVTQNPTVPTAAPTAVAAVGTIRLTKSDVNLRKTEGGAVLDKLNKNTDLNYFAISNKGGYTWYYVTTAAGIKGYIRGDCCQVIAGTAPTNPPSTGGSTTGPFGSFTLTLDDVMLRIKPAGTYIEKLKRGTVLPVQAAPTKSGSYMWYSVKTAAGVSGYVRGDTGVYSEASGGGATVAPTSSTGNYVIIINNAVNLRKAADGAFLARVNKDEVYPMTGAVEKKGAYDWYPIQTAAYKGYVRGDMCRQLTPEQVQEYLNKQPITSATPPPTGSVASSYLITTDSVRLRAAASTDSEEKANVPVNTVMAYTASQTVAGVLWYKIVYNNQALWVMGNYVKVMTTAEYEAWKAANPQATVPPVEVITGYVKTTSAGLNVRKEPGGDVIGRVDKGIVLAYQGTPTVHNKNQWYYCKTVYGYGYIVDTYLENCDASGAPVATPVPTATSSTKKEATYSTLKLGSSGTAVKELVTELKVQGYFPGEITSTYTNTVQAAVIAYQRAKGLSVDGVAGPNTQHMLFNTVPVGTGGEPNFIMYPCEKIDWYTGGIQTLWPKGKTAVIKDVKTGHVMNVYRWSGGLHADVEPLTAADTGRMCKMYGVSTSEQIATGNMWQRRPIWVTVGGRTFAASMYGVPHNYPDGDTIANNDFKGQFCVHFVNSRIHASQLVDAEHQAAIEAAYQAAPVKK